jgi:hypothetical protein
LSDSQSSSGSRLDPSERPGWARFAGHEPVDQTSRSDGYVVTIRRGSPARTLAGLLPPRGAVPALRDGRLHTADWRAGTLVTEPDPRAGFAPLGAVPEAGAPADDWRLSRRDKVWADDMGELVDQASGQQWEASRDIPWEAARGLDDTTERAVAQVMTFLAQNEYAALYVPAGFLPQVDPQLVELVLWLGSHIHDEARHIEVFTKRSLVGGHHAHALASTELSLSTLLDEHDFTASSLLRNVLGEGTYLDLLRLIETHAPDAATAASARLAHRDERRHVHFGIANIKRSVSIDPDMIAAVVTAAETRATKLLSLSGLSPRAPRGPHHHGGTVPPASGPIRRRCGRPRPDANDGAKPPPPPTGVRLRRRHGPAPLRRAHTQPQVTLALPRHSGCDTNRFHPRCQSCGQASCASCR